MFKSLSFLFVYVFVFSTTVFAQNTFEGYNIILDVPETQNKTACAIRYADSRSSITVTDLDSKTPLKLSACAGSGTSVQLSGNSATLKANASTNKWCFQGEDKRYRISFNGDNYSAKMTYDWIATPERSGFYNVKDFGAVGDGKTDDTIAIQSALAFMATRNGGTLIFPEGDYSVGNIPNFRGIVLPSGVIIQGISGIPTDAPTNNVVQKSPSRITLNGTNRALFRIGECTQRIVISDIELYANSDQDTYGIEAVGAYNSAEDFEFQRVTFSKFFRGIYAHALEKTNFGWQFDYVKVNHCRFVYNRDAGIWIKSRNSDWKVTGTFFVTPGKSPTSNANGIYIYHGAAMYIEDTFAGGFSNAKGGDFISVVDNSLLTVIGSQCEQMTRSFVYNEVKNIYAGDYSYPITFVNNVFGDPMEFYARRTFVSTGNLYGPNTFKADERLRVYSTGDRFCYDGGIWGCQGATSNNFDKATVVFMTGQPAEGTTQSRPTVFGTDVQFNQPVQLPSFLQNQLPNGKANGSMVYCSNCRRNSTPCQSGGNGAPAMVVGGQWSCL